MLECKEHRGLPLIMYSLRQTTPGQEDVRQSMFSPWTPSMPVPPSVSNTPCHTPLLPNSLVRPPHTWSKDEVRVWLEWCAGEFSIEPVSHDKFDMNGKALGLLTRSDFMERDRTSGDVLYRALHSLIDKHDVSPPVSYPSYTSIGAPPGVTPTFNHLPPSCPTLNPQQVHTPEHTNGIILFARSPTTTGVQPTFTAGKPQPSFVPILPGPATSFPSPMPQSKDFSPKIHIPGKSMLSPAPTTDTDSGAETEVLHEGEDEMTYTEDAESQQHHSPESTRDILPDLSMSHNKGDCRLLWEFIHQLLQENRYRDYVSWERQEELIFRIVNPTGLAELWGYQKNRTNMTYEKLSRALRYYYKMNIIRKVSGKRLTYQFLQHPRNIKKGQRGARPHSSRIPKQEPNPVPSPKPITEDRQNEACSPPMTDFHAEDQKPIISHNAVTGQQPLSKPLSESYDIYDNQCDLQLINGRLRPPLEDDEQEDHTVPYVKHELPMQEEPEDLSVKPFSARRSSEDSNYTKTKEEQEEESQIKTEHSS